MSDIPKDMPWVFIKVIEIVEAIRDDMPPKETLKKVHVLKELAIKAEDGPLIATLEFYEDHLNKQLLATHP